MTSSARAIIYTRQSTAREESISLELQETACRDYCARNAYEVIAVESDPGISGRTFERPGVKRALTAIEARTADVIVLWRWSRLSRRRVDWAIAVDRIEQAGGRIESALEPVDVATSAGRFARGMLAEFAAFESERIGDGWREAHARRVAQGLPHTPSAQFGYRVIDGAYVLDEREADLVRTLYARYLAGDGTVTLARWLRTATGDGRAWWPATVRRVLASGFAAGYLRVAGELRPGAHEPIIDRDTWEAYQREHARRSTRGTRAVESSYLLSGIVFCAVCQRPMTGTTAGRGVRTYRCEGALFVDRHAGNVITAAIVERVAYDYLATLAHRINAAADKVPTAPVVRRDYARELEACDAKLLTLTRKNLAGIIPDSAYVVLRDELARERDTLRAHVDRPQVDAPRVAHDLLRDWDTLPVGARRAILAALLERVEVAPTAPGRRTGARVTLVCA